MWFCDQCGLETSGGDPLAGEAPTCDEHGPRWRLIRNAPCAAAVIVKDDRVLLGRRAKAPFAGEWEVPGGFVERGEHPSDAAVREVFEELGIEVTLTGLVGIYVEPSARGENLQVTVYEATTTAEVATPDPAEVTEWAWFARAELPADLAGSHRTRLDDWLAGRTVPLPAGGGGD
ncbi:MAG: NUDIX domain-containing protein [Nocardioidaceae bacterium]|nr:NUDIX domain-containing protein [Nocardioidaceae bacterium]